MVPMAGLEPARAFYGPTDFKSVASTIPPHRRCDVHSKLLLPGAKMDFAARTASERLERVLVLGLEISKDCQLARPGGASCPDKLFGPVHSQATIAALGRG